MPGRTGRKSQIHENGTKIINGHSLRGNKNGLKNAPSAIDTNSTTTTIKSESSMNTNNESLLDQSLVQELITLAENVVSGQIDAIANNEEFKPKKSPALKIGQIRTGDLKNQKNAEQQQDDEDDIQVLAETKAKQRKRVLPLKLPPEFQVKIRNHLKSKGKTVDQVDILNITSEVCKQTLEKNGVGIANCSLRVWSSHTNSNNSDPNNQRASTNSKFPETNKGMSINGVKIEPSPNLGAVPLDSSSHNDSRSDFTTTTTSSSSRHQNNSFVKKPSKASGKKARKFPLDKLSDQPKSKRIKVSKRLHDHTMKEWPYQGPVSTTSNGQCTPAQQVSTSTGTSMKVKKKPKLKGPHRETLSTKLLRTIPFKASSGLVDVHVFNRLYSKNHIPDLNPNELLNFFHTLNLNPKNELNFKRWSISHLSLRSVSELFRALKAPKSIFDSFHQLSQNCFLPMMKVDPEAYKKTHLSQLSKNEFCDLFALGPCPTRVSTRTKQPTQKFQDSPCSSSMPNLVSSINSTPSPAKFLSPIPSLSDDIRKPNEKLEKARDDLRIAMKSHRRKVKPKYRFLFPRREKVCKTETTEDDFIEQLIKDVAADADEMVVIEEEDAASVIDVTEMSSRLCDFDVEEIYPNSSSEDRNIQGLLPNSLKTEPNSSTTSSTIAEPEPNSSQTDTDLIKLLEEKEINELPMVQKNSLAVRKFPSYGWSREREARIKATIQEKRAVSCPPAPTTTQILHPVDFPRFELSGLAETAPKEIEGWFVSKIKLLRKLSEPNEILIDSNRKSPGTSSKSGSNKNRTSPPNNKTGYGNGNKVSVTVALDQDVSIMSDLPDYKKELQRLNTIIDQIEDQENNAEQNNDSQIVDNEAKPNNEDLNEVLRTAKKIEKASVSGLGRQVSFPSLHCYLPSGWHCRKTSEDEGWIYVNSEGVKVKSIRAAMRYEAIKTSEKEIRQRKMNSTL